MEDKQSCIFCTYIKWKRCFSIFLPKKYKKENVDAVLSLPVGVWEERGETNIFTPVTSESLILKLCVCYFDLGFFSLITECLVVLIKYQANNKIKKD
uniref:Uncharacterized protein n=1 Tax=Octopus bimaculoides TaxID=37653 RepID=A0A0L8HXJ6_OCTBM